MLSLAGEPAELVVHADGEIHVHTPRADGAAVGVTLTGDDGAPHTVALHHADAVQGYVGRLESTAPVTGTATVTRVHEARATSIDVGVTNLLSRPRRGGSVLVVGSSVAEVLVRSDGSARVWGLPPEADAILVVWSTRGASHPIPLTHVEGEHRGRLEGAHPQPGPMQIILQLVSQDRAEAGGGTLARVEMVEGALPTEVPDVLPDLRLPEPELGRDLPAVIPIE